MLTYSKYPKVLSFLFASALMCVSSCGSKSADGSCTPGTALCPCDNGGCNSGLVCATNLDECVQLVTSGTGGTTGAGGTNATGGVKGTGGSASGGTTGNGGSVASGGTTGKGGSSASGGSTGNGGAKGGSTGSGGSTGNGGAKGGSTGSGGSTGNGGSGSGGSTGTGGVTSTACSLTNHGGSGSFTWYYFGQGTAKDGSGYRTACGYYGTESGSGQSAVDTIQNIASMSPASNSYFAAIPGQNGFDTKTSCGACVQITGQNGKQVVATIIDECPYGSDGSNSACASDPTGHLDLSTNVFNQLGYSTGNPSGTTWKFVPCPVTGNVVVRIKPGNANELFVENTILAITSVQGASKTSYGTWRFGGNLSSGQSIQLTDAANRTLTVNLKDTNQGENQDTGKQFPSCQ